jgi:hypothetical protein
MLMGFQNLTQTSSAPGGLDSLSFKPPGALYHFACVYLTIESKIEYIQICMMREGQVVGIIQMYPETGAPKCQFLSAEL